MLHLSKKLSKLTQRGTLSKHTGSQGPNRKSMSYVTMGNGNEEIHSSLIFWTGASSLDGLGSHPGHSLVEEFYPSAEMQSAYSVAEPTVFSFPVYFCPENTKIATNLRFEQKKNDSFFSFCSTYVYGSATFNCLKLFFLINRYMTYF